LNLVYAIYNANSVGAVNACAWRQIEGLVKQGYSCTVASNQLPAERLAGVEYVKTSLYNGRFWEVLDRLASGLTRRLPHAWKKKYNLSGVVGQYRFGFGVLQKFTESDSPIPDCFLCHQHAFAFGYARRSGVLSSVPMVIFSLGDIFEHPLDAFAAPMRKLYESAARAAYLNADCVVASSRALEKRAENLNARKVEQIPNGIDVDRWRGAGGGLRGGGRCRILYVGRLAPEKGVCVLLEAFAALKEGLAILTIVGTGESNDELKLQAEKLNLGDRVHFRGFVADEDLPAVYADADLLVMPSLSEGLPLVLLEAIASGLPVIGSAVGGIPDVIQNGINGLIVPPNDSRALSSAINELAGNRQILSSMSSEARQSAQLYDWSVIVGRIAKLVNSVVTTRRSVQAVASKN